jgi:hypothetical protein
VPVPQPLTVPRTSGLFSFAGEGGPVPVIAGVSHGETRLLVNTQRTCSPVATRTVAVRVATSSSLLVSSQAIEPSA